MIAMQKILSNLRGVIIKRPFLRFLAKPAVNLYQNYIFRFGPDRYTLSISSGESADFYMETRAEIRYFLPVFGELINVEGLLSDIRRDDVFYDVGAHVGTYTLLVSNVLNEEQIFAFEPQPANATRLKENLNLNDCNRVQVFELALSDKNTFSTITSGDGQAGSVGRIDDSSGMGKSQIQLVRGDALIAKNNLPPPTVLKIDVEGAELKVLRGLSKSLENCRAIYLEVSKGLQKFGDTKEELFDFLRKKGFKLESVGQPAPHHSDYKAYRQS